MIKTRIKGITSRISPFTTPQDIGGLLYSSGYRLLTLDFDEIRIAYPSMFELLYDIKGKRNVSTFTRILIILNGRIF